jgi:hypothetical protein
MVPHRRRNRLAACAFAALLAAGCAALGPSSAPYAIERNTLLVQNRGWEDVTVFVVRGETAIRIGVVPGLGSRTFLLPSAVTGPGGGIQLRAQRRISDLAFVHVARIRSAAGRRRALDDRAGAQPVARHRALRPVRNTR